MAANCPHCSESIESLPGFVSQSKLEERLSAQRDAKDGEITALKSALSTAQSQASGFEAIVSERDALKAEIGKRDKRSTRLEAMSAAGLNADLLEHVELLHTSATAGQDEPADFAAWLDGDGKAHPLLAAHFGQSNAAPPAATNNGRPDLNAPNANPPITNNTADPAPPGGKMTPNDVRAYLSSAEYKSLSAADQRAKITELKTAVHGQNAAQA
jgi:hypothetical protein